MEATVACLDTSILIDYYRKKDKRKSTFFQLTHLYKLFAVSIVTEYEVLIGSRPEQEEFWRGFFDKVTVLPFNKPANDAAISITKQLKATNKLIEVPDIFIAATALTHNLPLATLNLKHFKRIDGLNIIHI
ncbi:type II toxin-antitoxin system VapC family toxin [Parapedobacter sp. 2B3]|uniref:type II toxin-antitoxin system VapC family toxin n=1 Tax=Parapedobacter sp. 2B3 TaxID=3342381 RepID=UPI0035B60EDC